MKKLTLLIVVVFSFFKTFAQKGKISIGLQYRPLIPVETFDGPPLFYSNQSLETTVSNKFGGSFGMLIRRDFTDRWSLEFGINQTRRNYSLSMRDNSVDALLVPLNTSVGIISYEIPVQGLYYVKLSRDFFMNVMTGISFNGFPTDVAKYEEGYRFNGRYGSKYSLSLLANVGIEYRTKDKGKFYLGASLHRPINPIYLATTEIEKNGDQLVSGDGITGNFLSLDIRYFFKATEVSEKKKEPEKDRIIGD